VLRANGRCDERGGDEKHFLHAADPPAETLRIVCTPPGYA
jgi:hypothetical protein